jgi:hypothetical protein
VELRQRGSSATRISGSIRPAPRSGLLVPNTEVCSTMPTSIPATMATPSRSIPAMVAAASP